MPQARALDERGGFHTVLSGPNHDHVGVTSKSPEDIRVGPCKNRRGITKE
jgi:hypothetical protein